jgi:hypothetical protein
MPGSSFFISLIAGAALALPWLAAAQGTDELRLNYSVLYSSDLEGPYALAPSSRVFRSGEWVKLQVSSSSEGYLYILIKESDGKSQVLFPDAAGKINRNMNRVRPGARTTIPVNGAFRIAGSAGSDELTIVISRVPLVEPERLLGAGGEAAANLVAQPPAVRYAGVCV